MATIEVIAYIGQDKERMVSSGALMLYEPDPQKREVLSVDLAKAMKCDIVHLHCGDYLLIKL